MSRLREMLMSRNLAGRIVFTGMYNRLTSMDVRARQIAEPLDAVYVRGRYLDPSRAWAARCVIWVAVADIERVRAIGKKTRQIFDVINPSVEKGAPYFDLLDEFDTLIFNTRSTLNHLRPRSSGEWRSAVIPHHHCNHWGFELPEERLSRPRVAGYVGEAGHLHDADRIASAVRGLGLEFLMADSHDLAAYKRIDIGLAWTRPEPLRDDTRSNIKLTNFCSFGIPSVVCDYESYRDVDSALGGGACRIAATFEDFLGGLEEIVRDEELRRTMHMRSLPARDIYSVEAIAKEYLNLVEAIEGS